MNDHSLDLPLCAQSTWRPCSLRRDELMSSLLTFMSGDLLDQRGSISRGAEGCFELHTKHCMKYESLQHQHKPIIAGAAASTLWHSELRPMQTAEVCHVTRSLRHVSLRVAGCQLVKEASVWITQNNRWFHPWSCPATLPMNPNLSGLWSWTTYGMSCTWMGNQGQVLHTNAGCEAGGSGWVPISLNYPHLLMK